MFTVLRLKSHTKLCTSWLHQIGKAQFFQKLFYFSQFGWVEPDFNLNEPESWSFGKSWMPTKRSFIIFWYCESIDNEFINFMTKSHENWGCAIFLLEYIFSAYNSFNVEKKIPITFIHLKSENSQRYFTGESVIVWHDWHEEQFPDSVFGAGIHHYGNLFGVRDIL